MTTGESDENGKEDEKTEEKQRKGYGEREIIHKRI